ncbi:hypothetical protein [Streptomyces sp. NPDC056883]|uniref:hypothetical protein n=1 Tax=Streptomyces sp. NPDC056883 TaxID=3345959 RepID=UPI00368B7EB7
MGSVVNSVTGGTFAGTLIQTGGDITGLTFTNGVMSAESAPEPAAGAEGELTRAELESLAVSAARLYREMVRQGIGEQAAHVLTGAQLDLISRAQRVYAAKLDDA